MNNRKGFTLIELVMIIVILGILAAVAVPRFVDLQGDANAAAEAGVVGGIRAGIQTTFAENRAFPALLDAAVVAVCSAANPCFINVLDQGGIIDDSWEKTVLAPATYQGPNGGDFEYDPATGAFVAP